jgi:hypothetical protein
MTQISWLYLNVVGPFVVVAVGIIFSFIFPNGGKPAEAKR